MLMASGAAQGKPRKRKRETFGFRDLMQPKTENVSW